MSDTPAASPPPSDKPSRSGALAVAAGILASRLFGLVRQRVFAHYFGTSVYADVFNVGLRLPNLLQNLLGEGTLSASFIPVYAELLAAGKKEEAGRVAGAVFALLLALAGVLAIGGVALAPLMVRIVAPGFEGERYAMTVVVVRWLFPMTGLLVLSAWALGILNSHRRFLISYLAPVVWNAAIISALVWFGGGLGWRDQDLLYAVSIGALLGGVLQLLVQLPAVMLLERDLRIRWAPRMPGVSEVMRNAGPAVLGRGVVQLSSYLDVFLASLLAPGAVAAIGYAQVLYLLPVSLFGMSIAAAELPELARERAAGVEMLRQRARDALDRVAFLVVPSAVAFVVLGDVAVAAIYQTGAFGQDEVMLVHLTLAAYALGLVASTSSRILSSAFYALRDTRTPARVATVRVVASAGIGLVAMSQLEPVDVLGLPAGALSHLRAGTLQLGAVGLAFGTGIAAWIEWGLLRRALSTQLAGLPTAFGRTFRVWLAAGVAAGAGYGVRGALTLPPLLEAVAVFSVFGAVYLIVTATLGVPDAARVVRKVLSRIRR